MLNWLKNLSPKQHSHQAEKPVAATNKLGATVIPRDQHPISRKQISDNALKVMYRLNNANHDAYLVGGAVRDLLLGGHPKDFDIATDATPEQVRALFSNSRIIGRRFQIVHVRFGREIIEVTTFRGHHPESDDTTQPKTSKSAKSVKSAEGMLLRDNVYGTVEEDALRRDLTVNALYYSVKGFAVHDYCHAMDDLSNKVIRMIGEPAQRYREDPVRMLRVIRFAAKLGFQLHNDTAKPLKSMAELLYSIPSARLFDEVLKLFMSGHAVKTYQLLCEHQLFEKLFPQSDALKQQDAHAQTLIEQAFANTDSRINEGKPVTPAFIYAALLWPSVREEIKNQDLQKMPPMAAFHEAANRVIQLQQQHTAIPKRFQIPMREIWELQLRLPKNGGNRAQKLFQHPRFRAAYDFLLLREQSGEIPSGLGDWWTEYQVQNKAPDRTQHNAEDGHTQNMYRKPRKRSNRSRSNSFQARRP